MKIPEMYIFDLEWKVFFFFLNILKRVHKSVPSTTKASHYWPKNMGNTQNIYIYTHIYISHTKIYNPPLTANKT